MSNTNDSTGLEFSKQVRDYGCRPRVREDSPEEVIDELRTKNDLEGAR